MASPVPLPAALLELRWLLWGPWSPGPSSLCPQIWLRISAHFLASNLPSPSNLHPAAGGAINMPQCTPFLLALSGGFSEPKEPGLNSSRPTWALPVFPSPLPSVWLQPPGLPPQGPSAADGLCACAHALPTGQAFLPLRCPSTSD